MLEVIKKPEIVTERAQFEEVGHVLLPEVYDPLHVDGAIEEMYTLFRKHRNGTLGEQTASISDRSNLPKQPHLSAILKAIGNTTMELLGCELWPLVGDEARIVSIRMTRHTAGTWHQDARYLADPVAVTTLKGGSVLSVEQQDGTMVDHTIEAGSAVFLNNRMHLWHRGKSGENPRIGLGVARVPSMIKTR